MCSSDMGEVGKGMCAVLMLGVGGDVCSSDVGGWVGMCAVLILGWGCVQF